MNTGSELTSEMVGPAGSTREGVFSCTYPCACEDDDCPLDELLPEDWARAGAGARPASRQKRTAEKMANDRNVRDVIREPCLQVYSGIRVDAPQRQFRRAACPPKNKQPSVPCGSTETLVPCELDAAIRANRRFEGRQGSRNAWREARGVGCWGWRHWLESVASG